MTPRYPQSLAFFVNGVQVNGGTGCNLREGKLLFQSEGAEIFFRAAIPAFAAIFPMAERWAATKGCAVRLQL